MLITVSGLDGSGKSTLLASLRAALEADDRAVVVRHFNHDLGTFAAIRRILTPLRSGRDSQLQPGAVRPRATAWDRLRYRLVWNKPARRVLYVLDLILFALHRLVLEQGGRRVLLTDRYFYDTLVDISSPRTWGLTQVYARLVPAPDLAILLDVPPEWAFARKGEYSVEYLAQRAEAYHRVFGWVPSALVLDGSEPDGLIQAVLHTMRKRART